VPAVISHHEPFLFYFIFYADAGSMQGRKYFYTDCLSLPHSQFFLCTIKTNWLDGKHVVFGQVTKGMEVVSAVEQVGSQEGRTRVPVLISDCGQLL